MRICTNIDSGQHYIYIRDSNADKVFLIDSNGDIKSLSRTLFSDPEEHSLENLYAMKMLTPEQIWTFNKHIIYSMDENSDELVSYFGQLSAEDQMRFVEQFSEMLEDEGLIDKK